MASSKADCTFGAVDLIGQQNLVTQRSLDETETTVGRLVDLAAGQVTRHQVGRELNALKGGIQPRSKCVYDRGLCQTWRAFQ